MGVSGPAPEHEALLPCGAQVPVEPPFAPHREHAARVAAADENRILRRNECAQIARCAREQRQMHRRAGEARKARVEAYGIWVGVAACRADETHPRLALARV